MTVSNYVTPSASMNEEYMPEQELEQEGMLEEALEREPTEESADQDDGDAAGNGGGSGGGSDSGEAGDGDGDAEISMSATGEVGNSEEQTTIPSTFFSAMAYSIEAFLAAIEAQQASALMNIELYTDQVKQQQEVSVSLAGVIREKFKLEAKEIMMDAVMNFVTAGVTIGQTGFQHVMTKGIANEISTEQGKLSTLRDNYNNTGSPLTIAGNRGQTQVEPVRPDRLNQARRDAETFPVTGRTGADARNGLNKTETDLYQRMVKDDMNAKEMKISGLQQQRQMWMTYTQFGSEIIKQSVQGGINVVKSGIRTTIGEVEFTRSLYEHTKDLIGSLIQQIQGRISSSSKSMLDGVESLRSAIRQFQG